MSRQALSKRIRFEVFKRDSFTCQYCGRKAPDIIIEVDHIQPVAKGGTNDLLNLVTSCSACNSGKSDRSLDDSSVVEKQRRQLQELQERKEQIEMMFEWQKGLTDLDNHLLEQLCEFWQSLVPPFGLTKNGESELKKLLKKFSASEIITAMRTSVDQYVEYADGKPTQGSVGLAFDYVSRICSVAKAEEKKPYLRDLFYIRGILRKRISYVNDRLALQLLESAYLLGADKDDLKSLACTVKSWTQWRSEMEEFIDQEGVSHISSTPTEQDITSSTLEEDHDSEFIGSDNVNEYTSKTFDSEANDEGDDTSPVNSESLSSAPLKPMQIARKSKAAPSKRKRRN